MPNAATYLAEVRTILQNPAVPDADLLVVIGAAFRDVSPANYNPNDFDAQVIDTSCHMLLIAGKFPEIQSISSQGVSTSFSAVDPERFLKRMNARRTASWMGP